MAETRNLLMRGGMTYGLSMGIYWCFKYLFFMFSISTPFLNFIYTLLSTLVPIFAFFMTLRYKRDIGGHISFGHAWQFGILLYFFAAVIVSLEHYAFYQFVAPPDFLSKAMEQTIDILRSAEVNPEMLESVGNTRLTPITMAIQGIFTNFFYGIFLSIPVAWIATRIPVTFNTPDSDNRPENNQ